MPAPQAAMMKQLARLDFAQKGITVPVGWKQPQGKAGEQYVKAFHPSELSHVPLPSPPALFRAATPNKYHVDAQKELSNNFGKFIDETCEAICHAWEAWQKAATPVGVIVNGPVAAGGNVVGPPWLP